MNSRIKLSARLALRNSYLKILPLLTLIVFSVFVFSLFNPLADIRINNKYVLILFSVLSFLLFVLITAPARFWLEIKHFLLANGRKSERIKLGISGIKKSCVFYTVLLCVKTFWFTVFEAIPVTASVFFYGYLSRNSLSVKAVTVIGTCIVFLAVSGFCFYSVFIQRYSKSAFYLACYENFNSFDAISESVRKTQGRLGKILLFKLGFLPWFLLCIGIAPMLFVIPYYRQSLTIYFLK